MENKKSRIIVESVIILTFFLCIGIWQWRAKGTSLGLILCKEFIEKNGGKIGIESKENQGTSVTFTIPLNE